MYNLLILVGMIILLVWSIDFYLRIYPSPKATIIPEIAAKILNGNIEKSPFMGTFIVKGLYKGREVKLTWGIGEYRLTYLRFEIVHRGLPFKEFCMIRRPYPTKETVLVRDRIHWKPGYQDAGFTGISSEEELIVIFEELTEAAIIVEQNKPYYAQSK